MLFRSGEALDVGVLAMLADETVHRRGLRHGDLHGRFVEVRPRLHREVVLGQRLGKGKIVVPTPAQSQASSTALRKSDPEFVAWVDKFLAESYKSGQTQKWYEAALKDFGLDPALAPPIMKEMIK